MRLFLTTALVMLAFAGNSVLNRMALKGGAIGAMDFALWRLAAGALVLAGLALALRRGLPLGAPRRWAGALALAVYVVGFSLAYLRLDAGIGALILFGGVQVTMFAGALATGEALPARRWAGAGMALAGLGWLLWPGGAAPVPGVSAGLMAAAAAGWGIFSLIGRRAGDPLAATAASFVLALPMAGLVWLMMPGGGAPTVAGIGLAVLSGAVTSGLGYALWYAVLPALGAGRAAVAQLTVPVIAAAGGALMLAEVPGWRFAGAAALVLAGVGLAAWQRRQTGGPTPGPAVTPVPSPLPSGERFRVRGTRARRERRRASSERSVGRAATAFGRAPTPSAAGTGPG